MWDFWHGWDDLDSSLEEVSVEGVGGKEADPGRGVCTVLTPSRGCVLATDTSGFCPSLVLTPRPPYLLDWMVPEADHHPSSRPIT